MPPSRQRRRLARLPRAYLAAISLLIVLSVPTFVSLRRHTVFEDESNLAGIVATWLPFEEVAPSADAQDTLETDRGGDGSGSKRFGRRRNEGEGGMSACLLVKDVNHWLPEWIAYHYHVLPLRHLIVAVDPHSVTSPRSILERWNRTSGGSESSTERNNNVGAGLGLEIQLWHDEHYLHDKLHEIPPFAPKDAPPELVLDRIRERYLFRQGWFISRCLSAIKASNRTWTLLHDADEFVVFNRAADVHGKESMPPSMENGTVLEYIERTKDDPASPFHSNAPSAACLEVPRLLFGSKESSHEEITRDVPRNLPNFDPMNFNTLRYRHHVSRFGDARSGFVKPVMNAALIPDDVLKTKAKHPHIPYREVCKYSMYVHLSNKQRDGLKAEGYAPLIMNHYVGTWESFSFQRRWFLERYNDTRDVSEGVPDDSGIRTWLRGFVSEVGMEVARGLLEGSGVVEDVPPDASPDADGHYEGIGKPYGFSNESLGGALAEWEGRRKKKRKVRVQGTMLGGGAGAGTKNTLQ